MDELRGHHRQRNAERRAFAGFALHHNRAVMLGDDALANRQTQAGSVFLRREKGLEQFCEIFRRDAHTRVLDFNFQRARAVVSLRDFRADGQRTVRPIASSALRKRFMNICCNCASSPRTASVSAR